jgi:hypothetical protein
MEVILMTIRKPSISFLPMEDIAGDLVENKNFMTKTLVDADITTATRVLAKAVTPDQTTVENSLQLGGVDADKYMTASDGTKILGVADTMSVIFSDEVQNLRDEVYQLKSQLCKNGYVDELTVYEGFQDAFKQNNVKYESKICSIASSSLSLTDVLYLDDLSKLRDFEEGKHFVIVKTDTKETAFATVVSCDTAGKVEFYPSSSLLYNKDFVELHKTSGEYLRDSFSFSSVVSGVDLSAKEKYHMQSDDTMTTPRQINASNTGYGVYFKVPDSCTTNNRAALTNFTITTKAIGTPGNLLCHILTEDSIFNTGTFNPKFTSIEDAKSKGYFIATSQPILAENAVNESQLSFNFFNQSTNTYPEITNTKYLFIIECVNADVNNYWNVRFSYYQNAANVIEDLEKYNSSFDYHKVTLTGSNPTERSITIIDDIDKYDMLFTLTTRDIIDQTEYGNKEGLYTAKIVLPRPIDISRARLTTRIAREGCWYVNSYDSTYTKFTLSKEDDNAYSSTDLRFDTGDIIVIGNQSSTVVKSTSNSIEIATPIYIDSRIEKLFTKNNSSVKIPVYRMNYDVSLKPYFVDWTNFDMTKKEFVSTPVTATPIELSLTSIIPSGDNKLGSRVSDRLLFEGNFGNDSNGIAKLANEFELQIKWNSKFEFDEINQSSNVHNGFNELIGRIHNLSLTFDKNY